MKKRDAIFWAARANRKIDFGHNSRSCAVAVKMHATCRDRWGVAVGGRVAWTEDAADEMVTEYQRWPSGADV